MLDIGQWPSTEQVQEDCAHEDGEVIKDTDRSSTTGVEVSMTRDKMVGLYELSLFTAGHRRAIVAGLAAGSTKSHEDLLIACGDAQTG